MEILQIQAELVKAETMAHKSLKLIFNSQENLTDEQLSKIFDKHEKLGWLSFLVGETKIQPENLVDLPELPQEEGRKSQGARIRALIYLLWKKRKDEGIEDGDQDLFYQRYTEKIIESIKEKLDR